MKSKIRRRLLALMLCLAMLLNGNVSLLAEEGIESADQEVTVEAETLEETTVEGEESTLIETVEEYVEELFEDSEEVAEEVVETEAAEEVVETEVTEEVAETEVKEETSIDGTLVLTTELNGTVITMSGPKSSFPEGSEYSVSASEISAEAMEDVEASLRKVELATNEKIVVYTAYDIKLIVDGKEAQPVGDVNVTFQGGEVKAQVAGAENVEVYHVNEEKQEAESVEGDVVNNKVEMTTDHFSTYVITTTNEEGVTVTVQHYSGNTKIYRDSVEKLTVSQKLEDISVAANYTVDKVVKMSGTNETEVDGNDVITANTIYRVYYTPTTGETSGSVQVFDYQVQPSSGKSFNDADNYAKGSAKDTRVSAGKTDQQKDDTTVYNTNVKLGNSTQNVNKYTGGSTVVPGIITGINYETGALEMGKTSSGSVMNEPGFFTREIKDGKQVLSGYTLLFNRSGDTYTLNSVWNGETKADDAGANFYPLDAIKNDHKDNANSLERNNDHNHFFGLRYDIEFKIGDYVGPLNFSFTGDDDMWVVLDAKGDANGGKVVVDLGGIHQKNTGEVDIWSALGLNASDITDKQRNQTHTLTILYMERGAGESNCNMTFTLPNSKVINSTKNPTSFEFNKVTSSNSALAGATFGLYDSNNTLIDTVTSDANGKVKFDNLYDGTYTIEETKAPTGYVKSPVKYTLSVVNRVAKMTVVGSTAEVTSVTNYTVNEEAVSNITYNKTATLVNENDRTYKLTLTAATKGENEGTAAQGASIVLVLDASYSMQQDGKSLKDVKDAAISFVNSIYKVSPESEVAVIWYKGEEGKNSQTINTTTFKKLSTNLDDIVGSKGAIDNGAVSTSALYTPMGAALATANTLLDSASYKNQRYVVFFTDGLPGHDSRDANFNCMVANNALINASLIKEKAVLYTVGYALGNSSFEWEPKHSETSRNNHGTHSTTTSAANFLKNYIATQPVAGSGKTYAFTVEDKAELEANFNSLAGTIGSLVTVQADKIVDVIDSRFELTAESKKALKDKYGDNVEITTVNGVTTITWLKEAAIIANEKDGGWKQEIIIQAKPDFMGGNAIPTNGPESGIVINGTTKPFPQPSVNVKLLDLFLEGKEITIYKGDVVDSAAFAEALADSLKAIKLYREPDQKILVITELTQEQLNTLKTTGEVEVGYSYSGTSDVIGKFVLEYQVSNAGSETHTLKVTYIADTVAERMAELNKIDQPKADGGTVVTRKEVSAAYVVNVISGTIQITKTLKTPSNKDQLFTFTVRNADNTFNQTVSITVKAGETSAIYQGDALTNLARGTYTITENEAYGFVIDEVAVYTDSTNCQSTVVTTEFNESVTFVLGNSKSGQNVIKNYTYNTADGGTQGSAHFTNDEAIKDWAIVKRSSSSTDSNVIPLQGAEFELRLKTESVNSVWYKGISEADGTITWYMNGTDKLVAGQYILKGEYILKETKAPAGYSLSDVEWTVVIAAKGYLKSITADKVVVDNKAVFYFDNTPVYSLPSAGGLGIFVYMIGGVMLMAFATLVLYKNRRKEVLAK